MASNAKWFVVHTYSGYENKVVTNIKIVVENRGLQDEILDVVVPTTKIKEIKNGKETEIERKLFPGYVFVKVKTSIKYEHVGSNKPVTDEELGDLINSGDKILKIEAVLSGTLNYIFNTISADIPFSETVRLAKENGYSEPDPRIDLSGKDVIRKLVILSREAGYKVNQSDVEKHLFVPDNIFEGCLDEFWQKLPALDHDFETRRQQLEQEGKRWKFVAKLENGKASVSLQEVDSHHPFFDLEGSNNIIMLSTERYKEYPMLIQGYGAGASVTAAGVFADIMSIANI